MLTIRRYQQNDREAVWRLHNEALQTNGTHAGNGPWDDDLHTVEQVYLQDGGEFLVGTMDGQIVAMGALQRRTPDRAELKRMRVFPAWQRRGFGERILLALEARAVELGFRTLFLDTTEQQPAARGLYEKHGYVEVRRERWRNLELLIYEKTLGER